MPEDLRLVPSAWLLRGVFALCGLAALAAAWPPALSLAVGAAACLFGAAAADQMMARATGYACAIDVRGEEGASTAGDCVLRFTVGREARLTVRCAAAGSAAGCGGSCAIAVLAAGDDVLRCLDLPAGVARVAWTPTPWFREVRVNPLRRGVCAGLRVGIERGSRCGLWRVREWHRIDAPLRIYPDLAPARRALMRSPVYRALVAAAPVPLIGHGREFERLREYQPGDSFGDISWKATARRAFPVTRLFQWEQRQQIYFVVDHSRSSRLEDSPGRAWLDAYVETALAGAGAALEVGDEFGLITFSDTITGWLPAASGIHHFTACRERLLEIETRPATPDFDRLFAGIRAQLRRRCYLLLLSNLAEPGFAEPFAQAAALVSRTHLILTLGILPREIQPLFSTRAANLEDVYGQLAGELELQRLQALSRGLALQGIHFQAVPASRLTAAAVDGYLQCKREQRL